VEWITSIGGFSRNQFFPAPQATRFPTLAELDADRVLREHPVFIMESFSGPGQVNAKAKKIPRRQRRAGRRGRRPG